MIGELMQGVLSLFNLDGAAWSSREDARRKYVRYRGLRAEVIVGNQTYSVRDWGLGGVSFDVASDEALIAGDNVQIEMKFRFLHDTITVQQPAQIVRSARRGIAAVFSPLPTETRRQFDRVLDSLHTENFLKSHQAA